MRRIAVLLSLALCAACTTVPEGQKSTKPASGPPEVRLGIVEEHARQFDEEEPVRLAGSQEELAASAYVVAHLTDAGYVSRLDAVPVEDTVRSTNVVALPPSGAEAEVIVVVPYDSAPGSTPEGIAIGVWLEVARALRVLEPEHSVQFVALGAEHTDVGGGLLGSRRLVRQLVDDGRSPAIVVVAGLDVGSDFVLAGGSGKEAVLRVARRLDVEASEGPFAIGGEAFQAAGFETAVVSGGAEAVGPVLLEYLSGL